MLDLDFDFSAPRDHSECSNELKSPCQARDTTISMRFLLTFFLFTVFENAKIFPGALPLDPANE